MQVTYGGARCNLLIIKSERNVYLSCFETEPTHRRQGHGKKLLRIVKKWALRNNMSVTLMATPYRDKPISLKTLQAFYTRMGFLPDMRTAHSFGGRGTPLYFDQVFNRRT